MENDFKKLSNTALVSQLKGLASRERLLTAEILRYLGEVQSRRLFLELGYSSLFSFCVRHLGFTEGETQRRISAMRVIREIPSVEAKVEQETLSLSAVAQVASFCSREEKNLEEKRELLDQVSGKTTRECEKILLGASDKPEPPPVNKITQVSLKQTKLTVTITPEVFEQLKKLKNLLSHKNPKMSYGELVAELAAIGLKKLDPSQRGVRIAKAEAQAVARTKTQTEFGARATSGEMAPAPLAQPVIFAENDPGHGESMAVRQESPLAQTVNLTAGEAAGCGKKQGEDKDQSKCRQSEGRGNPHGARLESFRATKVIATQRLSGQRDHIPAYLRRQVWLRDKACCSFISHDNVKCQSTFMLEVDHVEPVSLGGVNSYQNLRVLCRNHNVHMAEKVLGRDVMRAFVAKVE